MSRHWKRASIQNGSDLDVKNSRDTHFILIRHIELNNKQLNMNKE